MDILSDMRVVPFGSVGATLDLDWFLNYRDTKLVIQASEIKKKVNDLLAYCKH